MRYSTLVLSVSLLAATTVLAMAQDDRKQSRTAATMIVLRSIEKEATNFSAVAKSGFTRGDLQRIAEMLRGKGKIVPLRTFVAVARSGEETQAASVTGTTGDFANISRLRIVEGRFLSRADETNCNNVAVLGLRIADALFPDENPVGQTFRIDQQAFVVVGVSDDDAVYIPLTTMRARFGDTVIKRASGVFEVFRYELSEIRIALTDSMHLASVVEAVNKLLDGSHEAEDYSVELVQ